MLHYTVQYYTYIQCGWVVVGDLQPRCTGASDEHPVGLVASGLWWLEKRGTEKEHRCWPNAAGMYICATGAFIGHSACGQKGYPAELINVVARGGLPIPATACVSAASPRPAQVVEAGGRTLAGTDEGPRGMFPCGKRCGWRVARRLWAAKSGPTTGGAAIAFPGLLRHGLRQQGGKFPCALSG